MMRRLQRLLDILSLAAGFVVIIVFLVEELSKDAYALSLAATANWLIWIIFLADFVVRWAREGTRAFWRAKTAKLDLAVVVLTSPFIELALASSDWLGGAGVLRLWRLAPRASRVVGRLS